MKQNLALTHHFQASVLRVWQAWTDGALVQQWWGPDHFTCPSAVMDVQVGGSSLLCMRAPAQFGGRDTYSKWTYTEIVPHQKIEFTHTLTDEKGDRVDPVSQGLPADFPQDQRQVVEFEDLGDGTTEVIITEYDWTVGQMMEMSRLGMEQCLHKMAKVLAQNI